MRGEGIAGAGQTLRASKILSVESLACFRERNFKEKIPFLFIRILLQGERGLNSLHSVERKKIQRPTLTNKTLTRTSRLNSLGLDFLAKIYDIICYCLVNVEGHLQF